MVIFKIILGVFHILMTIGAIGYGVDKKNRAIYNFYGFVSFATGLILILNY